MRQNYIFLLFLYFIGAAAMYSQTSFSNSGILVIEPGTQISAEDFTNNAGGTFSNNGDLSVKGNYTNDGVIVINTDSGIGTTTFNQQSGTYPSETIQNISGTGEFEFNNLVVDNNTSLGVLVADGIGLFVNNEIYLQEGDLRLDGESQLIQGTGSTVNALGTGSLLIDQQGIASRYGYNYWSSPVNDGAGTSYSLANVLYDGTDSSVNPFSPTPIQFTPTTDVVNGSNGSPSVVDGSGNVTAAATIGARYLYQFLNGDVDDYNDWVRVATTAALDPGTGYTMKGTNTTAANQNYTFKGQPNNGNYTFVISAIRSSLLGNPYPSAYDTDALIRETTFMNEVYFWKDGGSTNHALADYLGGYATRNLTGGAPGATVPSPVTGTGDAGDAYLFGAPGQYMAVGQGFFVETNNPFVGFTVNFVNSDREFITEGGGDSKFFKNAKKGKEIAQKEDLSKQSNVRIGYEDPEGFHRQLLLGFIPGSVADINFNENYDAFVSGPREDDLFFIIENDPTKQYVIQGVGAFNEDVVLPLSLTIAEEGVHTIMLDAVENFDGSVYIYDKVLDITYNISDASFSPNLPIGQYNDRFEVVFKQQASLGTDDERISNFNVYFDGGQNLIVKNKNNFEVRKLSVFNTLGQQLLVVNNNKLEQSQTAIPFSYQMGVYIVVVESNEGKETFRIINK